VNFDEDANMTQHDRRADSADMADSVYIQNAILAFNGIM
jgi:hypothetical protein